MKRLIALLALSLAITSAFAGTPVDAARSALNFNYTTAGREGVGLLRAFDDGHKTILQFVHMNDHKPTITSVDGTPIAYKNMGDYAVLPTLYREVRIYVDDKIATVKSATASPVQIAQQEVPHTPATPQPPLPTLAPSQKTIIDPYDMASSNTAHPPATRAQPSAAVGHASPAATAAISSGTSRTSFTVEQLPPATSTPALTVWIAHRGDWLSDTIAAWSKKAGWQVPVWTLHFDNGNKADYPIPSDLTLDGNFQDATTTLVKAFIGADPTAPMDVKINPDQRVIIVTNAKAK
jgi:hypothetical protein